MGEYGWKMNEPGGVSIDWVIKPLCVKCIVCKHDEREKVRVRLVHDYTECLN